MPAPQLTTWEASGSRKASVRLTGDGRLRIEVAHVLGDALHPVQNPEYVHVLRRYTAAGTENFNESQYSLDLNGNVFAGRPVIDEHRFIFSFSDNKELCSLRTLPGTNPGEDFGVSNARKVYLHGTGGAANGQAFRNSIHTLLLGANLMSTSDRRVAIELGCSLPIVNNPIVDHGRESPDIVIGRWMFNPKVRIKTTVQGTEMTFEGTAPDVFEFQNSTDRVQYHSLMPQDKIHFVRLKMYARVRKYNYDRDRFDMESVVYPMRQNDWWHARLHFVSKD